ncbi:MAG: carbohydrate ABC transporter permease [Defluviitaleaceae bacterium]|nr:carbohydrate ABC transporter permease [Defluviitaleaceae bacterium]
MTNRMKAWMNSPSFDNTVQRWTGKVKDLIVGIVMAIIIIGVCYTILSPIFAILSRAFMTEEDIINPLVFLIPQNFTLNSISLAIKYMDYWNTLARTLLFALTFSALHVFVCSMVGYGFARFKFHGSNVFFALVVVTIVVPVHSIMVPMFLNFSSLNLLNTWFALGLLTITGVGLRSGLYIYIFRQFFRGLPKEIEEAAFIDGAGPFYTYARIMMPNAVPAIVTVLLFSFVWHYNDTFYTTLLMRDTRLLATSLLTLGDNYAQADNITSKLHIQMVVYAGVLLAVTPILTIYMFLQRFFVEGLERSGIVG